MTLTEAQRRAMFAKKRYIISRNEAIYLSKQDKKELGLENIKQQIHQRDVKLARKTFGQKPTASQVRAIHEEERKAYLARTSKLGPSRDFSGIGNLGRKRYG